MCPAQRRSRHEERTERHDAIALASGSGRSGECGGDAGMRRDFPRRRARGHAHDEFGRAEATRRLRIEPADEPSRRVRRE